MMEPAPGTTHNPAVPTLRSATTGDLAAVERLIADTGLHVDGIADIFATHAADFVVAEDPESSGKLAAVAGLEVCRDDALLRSVAVRPEWRARGLGRDLVRRIVSLAEARGVSSLYLLTTTAEHYFPRFGFTRIDRDAVPLAIRDTIEFRTACPASAIAMTRALQARPE